MILPFEHGALAGATDELDEWAKRLDERILSRRWARRLRRAIEAEAVAASTSMEGVPVTVADTLKILAGDPRNLRWGRELVVGVQDRVLAGDLSAGAGRLPPPSPGRAVDPRDSD